MAKDEVLFGYALLDDTKHTVNINDIDQPFTRLHKFYCPHCHKEMYATFGDVQLHHFRHYGKKCQYSKYLHDLAENVFHEEYSKCLDNGWPFFLELRIPTPCNTACVLKNHADCKEHYINRVVDLTKEYTFIFIEPRVNIDDHFRRPDILLESFDSKQLWIEFWVSHETEQNKRNDSCIIEIKIDDEKDLEKIRQHKIVQSEGKGHAVRIFGVETDRANDLFEDMKSISGIKFPCDRYYCFEVGVDGYKSEFIDNIITSISQDLIYRVVLRLNWKGIHSTIEGPFGRQITKDELERICSHRFLYYGEKEKGSPQYNQFDSLVEFEFKSQSDNSQKPQEITQNPYFSQGLHYQQSPFDDDTEWVDLGLPSGTLWAMSDINDNLTFEHAMLSYGLNLPSLSIIEELRQSCSRKWNDDTHTLVFTGPNGNSISFPCKDRDNTYWLNAYEQGDPEFGQCFHIGPDEHFWINDKESHTKNHVRLVRK